ncbi:MAG: putative toxin-antitoxin system toxin component, PIN family [Solirubrobacterales bacterium]
MIRAVLDTNIIVSGLGRPRSVPARVIDHALSGAFIPVTSPALLSELERALRYPKLREAFEDPGAVAELVGEISLVVEPDKRLHVIKEDEHDNRVLEAARAADADFAVSGDEHLLSLGSFERTRIVRPGDFIAVLRD